MEWIIEIVNKEKESWFETNGESESKILEPYKSDRENILEFTV